jgi:hypothetical protein
MASRQEGPNHHGGETSPLNETVNTDAGAGSAIV